MSHPIPLTLLLCDHAWRDPNSGKFSLLGIFSGYASSVFPFPIDVTVYFAVTDGSGMLPVRMELIDVDEERPAVVDATANFRFDDRRQVIEGMFACHLTIDEPGEYRVKLYVAGEFMLERSLTITKIAKRDDVNPD